MISFYISLHFQIRFSHREGSVWIPRDERGRPQWLITLQCRVYISLYFLQLYIPAVSDCIEPSLRERRVGSQCAMKQPAVCIFVFSTLYFVHLCILSIRRMRWAQWNDFTVRNNTAGLEQRDRWQRGLKKRKQIIMRFFSLLKSEWNIFSGCNVVAQILSCIIWLISYVKIAPTKGDKFKYGWIQGRQAGGQRSSTHRHSSLQIQFTVLQSFTVSS